MFYKSLILSLLTGNDSIIDHLSFRPVSSATFMG